MPHYDFKPVLNTDDKFGEVRAVDLYAQGNHNGPVDNLRRSEKYDNPAHTKDSDTKGGKSHLVLIRD